MSKSTKPAGAPHNAAAPSQPSSKAAAAAPKLESPDVEMGRLNGADGAPSADTPAQPDIMQLARTGDVAAMQALFDDEEYDATYTDDEGITPLHVCLPPEPELQYTHANLSLS